MEYAMPTDPPYYTSDVPDDQKKAVKAVANRILRRYEIESAALLLTNVDLPEELVINTSNLQLCPSLPPASSTLLPDMELLESLVSRFSNILIIPLWVVDLYMVAHGDRVAASRFIQRINPRRLPDRQLFRKKADELGVSEGEVRLEVMTTILLQVVSYRDRALTAWSSSEPVQLHRPDGTPETAVPNQLNLWTFRQWAELQTIENTERRLQGEPLHLDILIDVPEDESEPSQLWWYPDLPPARRGGRPPRDIFGGKLEEFMARVGPAIVYLRDKGRNPTIAAVAELIDASEDTLVRAARHYGFPDGEAVVIKVNNAIGQS
jgi:hypothetical protein